MNSHLLQLRNITVFSGQKKLIDSVSFAVKRGEVHAIMGPNGAGKSTLGLCIMGYPSYRLDSQSSIVIDDEPIQDLEIDKRAKKGLFLSFQSPIAISGVSLLAFLRSAYKQLYPQEKVSLSEFKTRVADALIRVGLSTDFMKRSLNEGFSGGERKRCEIVQILVLKPAFVILDEIDSGLDIDSLKTIALLISEMAKKENMGIILITHYQRILHEVRPNKVHVLIEGVIKKTGGLSLVRQIEKDGYATIS